MTMMPWLTDKSVAEFVHEMPRNGMMFALNTDGTGVVCIAKARSGDSIIVDMSPEQFEKFVKIVDSVRQTFLERKAASG